MHSTKPKTEQIQNRPSPPADQLLGTRPEQPREETQVRWSRHGIRRGSRYGSRHTNAAQGVRTHKCWHHPADLPRSLTGSTAALKHLTNPCHLTQPVTLPSQKPYLAARSTHARRKWPQCGSQPLRSRSSCPLQIAYGHGMSISEVW